MVNGRTRGVPDMNALTFLTFTDYVWSQREEQTRIFVSNHNVLGEFSKFRFNLLIRRKTIIKSIKILRNFLFANNFRKSKLGKIPILSKKFQCYLIFETGITRN